MPDFGILQTPDFARAALSGYQAGSALGKQKQIDAAMAGIDLERPETLLPVLRADPSTGAALIGASTKLAAEKREIASRAAIGSYIKSIAPGGSSGVAASPGQATASVAPADPQAPAGSDSADIVVQGHRAVNPNAARDAAIDADPQAFLDIQSKLGTMDEAQRKRVADATGAFSAVGNALLQIPYGQRRGYIQAHAADLAAHGVPAEKIASFDPTDDNIHFEVGQAIGIKGQLERADKDRSFALDEDKFAEQRRHADVEEGQGAARVAQGAQSVSISAGHLALARDTNRRAGVRAAGAGGTPAAAVPHYEYRVVNGVTQKRLIK